MREIVALSNSDRFATCRLPELRATAMAGQPFVTHEEMEALSQIAVWKPVLLAPPVWINRICWSRADFHRAVLVLAIGDVEHIFFFCYATQNPLCIFLWALERPAWRTIHDEPEEVMSRAFGVDD